MPMPLFRWLEDRLDLAREFFRSLLGYALMVGGLAALLLAVVACSGSAGDTGPKGDKGDKGDPGTFSAAPSDRQFYLTGVEWKGTTNTDDLDPPSVNPKTLSDGYGYNAPGFDAGNPDDWRVATYVWPPASMTVIQGDDVHLTAFIVNGNKHEVWVEAPDGSEAVATVEMNRGREYEIHFDATQAGIYTLFCDTHSPSMTAYISVLPTS